MKFYVVDYSKGGWADENQPPLPQARRCSKEEQLLSDMNWKIEISSLARLLKLTHITGRLIIEDVQGDKGYRLIIHDGNIE